MTSEQIISLSRKKLLEADPDIITDELLYTYANLTQKDIIKKVFPNNSIQEATITFTSGSGSLPSDFGTLYTDAYSSEGKFFPEVSIADFQRRLEDVDNAIVIEAGGIKVSPIETTSLTIKYYPTYSEISSSVNPTIEEYFHEAIIYGVLYRAFEDLQDPELSKYYENKFKTMIEEKSSDFSNYEEDAQRGNQMFNGIRIL